MIKENSYNILQSYHFFLQALKNQSELVQTPGLFDSPVEQNRGRGLALLAQDDVGGKADIVDNHIVSY